MSIERTISRPYAQAIFDIAIRENSIEKWKKILIFFNMIASHPKITRFLSGSLSQNFLSSVFIIISGDIIDENAKNLIKILAENQRLKMLNNILEQFLELESYYKKNLIVELRTAFLLEKKQIINIQRILEKSLSSKITFIYKIDNSILDGMILKVNNTVFDLSVRSYLKQLSDALNF